MRLGLVGFPAMEKSLEAFLAGRILRVSRARGRVYMKLMVLLMVLLLSSVIPPAQAKFHPLKAAKKAIVLTAGAVAFPVVAPVNYVGQKLIIAACYAKADWRMAAYVAQDKVYDWCWLENWWY